MEGPSTHREIPMGKFGLLISIILNPGPAMAASWQESPLYEEPAGDLITPDNPPISREIPQEPVIIPEEAPPGPPPQPPPDPLLEGETVAAPVKIEADPSLEIQLHREDFSGRALLRLSPATWYGVKLSYIYGSEQYKGGKRVFYGPAFALGIRLPNPTIITPWMEAGPGYRTWRFNGDLGGQDRASSFTLEQRAGINLALSPRFFLVVRQSVTRYQTAPPDRTTLEEGETRISRTEFLFRFTF